MIHEILDEGVAISCGDCSRIMSSIGKDFCLVTDPPYGIDYGRAGGFSASHGWGPWRENVKWDKERPKKFIFDLMRSTSQHAIIWGGNYFTDYLPPTSCWFVWDKGQRSFSLADCELAWCSMSKAARVITYARGLAVRDGKQHPTQKPVAVMEWCIQQLPKEPKWILDPFMGSGSTGVAAIKLGRPFMGIEKDERYYQIAKTRLQKALEEREQNMFKNEPIQIEQANML